MVSRAEVEEFINSIKEPEVLLRYCRKYHEQEPRDIAYVISRYIVIKGKSTPVFTLAGCKLIVITWNAARYQRLGKEVKRRLSSDIAKAYEEAKGLLSFFDGMRLENVEFDDELRDKVGLAFRAFSSKPSIGVTGASKLLHLLNPSFFMMWDSLIRQAYHKLHYMRHSANTEACYVDFLQDSQAILRALLSKVSEEELWERHMEFMDQEVIKAFSYRETILKMLDEANYVRFTYEIKL